MQRNAIKAKEEMPYKKMPRVLKNAIKKDDVEKVKALVAKQKDQQSKRIYLNSIYNNRGGLWTPISYAASRSSKKVLAYLISNKQVDIRPKYNDNSVNKEVRNVLTDWLYAGKEKRASLVPYVKMILERKDLRLAFNQWLAILKADVGGDLINSLSRYITQSFLENRFIDVLTSVPVETLQQLAEAKHLNMDQAFANVNWHDVELYGRGIRNVNWLLRRVNRARANKLIVNLDWCDSFREVQQNFGINVLLDQLGSGSCYIECPPSYGKLPVRVYYDADEVVPAILKQQDVPINNYLPSGDTPLIFLLRELKQKVSNSLLNEALSHPMISEKINIHSKIDDRSALMLAAELGEFAVVEWLLQIKGIDLHDQDKNGYTPLIMASKRGHKAIVEHMLTRWNFDIHHVYAGGKTLLMLAAEHQLTSLVVAILEKFKDIDVNQQDDNGDTALLLAARKHDDAVIVSALLGCGADANIQNKKKYNAIMEAKRSNHKGLCPMLKRAYAIYERAAPAPSAPSLGDLEVDKGETTAPTFSVNPASMWRQEQALPTERLKVEKTESQKYRS